MIIRKDIKYFYNLLSHKKWVCVVPCQVIIVLPAVCLSIIPTKVLIYFDEGHGYIQWTWKDIDDLLTGMSD